MPWQDGATRQLLREGGRRHHVLRPIRKRHQMHARARAEVLEHMETADLVAAIGRKRHAVRQEQQVAHPRPREIHGPARFAAQSGIFFQLRTISAYLGLSGLTSRAGPSLRFA